MYIKHDTSPYHTLSIDKTSLQKHQQNTSYRQDMKNEQNWMRREMHVSSARTLSAKGISVGYSASNHVSKTVSHTTTTVNDVMFCQFGISTLHKLCSLG